MTTPAGRFEMTELARLAVLNALEEAGLTQANDDPPGGGKTWLGLAEQIIRAAVPHLEWADPPISKRQDELDGEYVLTVRAQRAAAEQQAVHFASLTDLVVESRDLALLQTEVAKLSIAELHARGNYVVPEAEIVEEEDPPPETDPWAKNEPTDAPR